MTPNSRRRLIRAILYVTACVGIALSLAMLARCTSPVERTTLLVGSTPLDILAPADAAEPAPAVVMAHGFSTCRQFLYPLGYSLARNGYLVAIPDLSGHGKNGEPFPYNWLDVHRDSSPLAGDLQIAIDAALERPESDGRLALLGYSMGSGIVMRYARDTSDVEATIGVSSVFSDVLPGQPRNLLLLTGAWEMEQLKETALAALKASGGSEPEVTSGDFGEGNANRLVFVPAAEHILAPLRPRTSREALEWLDATFSRESEGELDRRLPWVLVFCLSVGVLFLPVSRIILSKLHPPQAAREASSLEIGGFLMVTVLPAVATPLLLAVLPFRLLPLSVGDYLVAALLCQGIMMMALLYALGCLDKGSAGQLVSARALLAACVLFSCLMAPLATVLDDTLVSMLPTVRRAIIIAAVALLIAPYFVASEYVARTHYPGLNRWFPAMAKVILVASLAAGAFLGGPFVLMLFLPGIVALQIGLEIAGRWLYAHSGHTAVAGILNALVYAWLIGVLFPIT